MDDKEMQAGPELDTWMAENVMGWEYIKMNDAYFEGTMQWVDTHASGIVHQCFYPSSDIAAAMQVVEKLQSPEMGFRLTVGLGYRYHAEFWDRKNFYQGDAATAPLAICRAARKMMDRQH